MQLEEGYQNLRTDYNWNIRFNQVVSGNNNFDIPRDFTSGIIAILGDTTNINPSNVVGYIVQTVDLFQIGGIAQVGNRIVVPNKIPTVMISESSINPYRLRWKFAFPVGHCTLKIWEAVPK
ncbi:hypothetical protein [Nostoc sp.]|uniref:hypothetical protein n=1 Tax=Nostoc sp. TaxID=1180 RepID=UPI002FFCE2D0